MRLWHYKLIPFLPDSQLIAQWRELNSIFKKQDKHILINYIYEYPKDDLYCYGCLLRDEMHDRGIKIKSYNNWNSYFGNQLTRPGSDMWFNYIPFKRHQTDRYLLQCFYNLQEKYDRGQKDFSKKQYEKLYDFVNNELDLDCNQDNL